MSAMWIIYLADVVGGLTALFGVFGMLILVLQCFAFPIFNDICDSYKEGQAKAFGLIKIATPSALFMLLLAVFIPSKQTIYMMAAAKVGQDIVEAPATKEISDKVLKLINQKLDEQLGGGK